ncbi:MAG TPA: NADPH-dependent F420 reductase [Phototrophicaceae bacterium]|nr:NADPH-dependent F420 reductase [Phototrophicaceae bacterium]
MTDERMIMTIAVLGGTGKEGSGLALRWALKGYRVIIGSRDAERAQSHAAAMNAQLGGAYLSGAANAAAAAQADVVVLSVPYAAHQATLEGVREHLGGKVVVDLTVPLQPPKVRTVHLPEGKAAALEAQALLGEAVKVVAAFQNVSAVELDDPAHGIDCDVLVCGDDAGAKATVMKLVEACGLRGVDAGPLANAIAVEALTPVLLYINKAYGIKGAGIRITGIAE